MAVEIGSLLAAIAENMENPYDTIRSIGTYCGIDRPSTYVIHVKREDGTEYDINI